MPATAFVLAAGRGTRLRPLTHHRPKPLVPVCGIPMLDYTLADLAAHGHTEAVVNAFHHAGDIDAWARRDDHPLKLHVSVETDILGTGGGIRKARELLDERFVVVNGDVLHTVDLTSLLAAVPPGGAAMALRVAPQAVDTYGPVFADAQGVVTTLSDVVRTNPVGAERKDTHFTGIHAMSRSALDLVGEGEQCIVRTAYKALVPHRKVGSIRHEGTWLDVGNPAVYLSANLAALTTRLPLPLDPTTRAWCARGPRGSVGALPPGVKVEGAVWIGKAASVPPGVELTDCVIGPRSFVSPGARLRRCVVWDGAEVPAGTYTDTIFFEGGMLAVSP